MAEALGVVSSVIAILDLSGKLIKFAVQYLVDVKGANENMRNLVAEITECHTAADEMDQLLKNPKAQELRSSRELASMLEPARVTLKELLARLEKSSHASLGSLKWPQMKGSVEDTVRRLDRARERILFMMNVDQTFVITVLSVFFFHFPNTQCGAPSSRAQYADGPLPRRRIQNIEHRIIINNLPVAEGAAFDSLAREHSTACFPDTRVEILDHISQWINGTDSPVIFWLSGMAGTGKSTISQTVAQTESEAGRLGASFFFKKGEADRGSMVRFMSTLARQLADRIPGVGPLIKAVVDQDPSIGGKRINEQFDKLIKEPLGKVLTCRSHEATAHVVIVIDALDECENIEDVQVLIHAIASAQELQVRSPLRFFLTSRPELPIRLGFERQRLKGINYQHIVLHGISPTTVERDLAVFFRIRFDAIRSDFNSIVDAEPDKLPTGWPGHQILDELASRSSPLFISAATLCRFVSDPNRGNPKTLLAQVLSSATTGSLFSQTYRPILDSQLLNVPTSLRAGIIKDFILVVGSIVILAEPLGVLSLTSLLGESRDTICDRLRLLHAVLRVPQNDSPIRVLHLSFRDYLLDSSLQEHEANPFHVDQDRAHRTLAGRCMSLLSGHPLRQKITYMCLPGMRKPDVDPPQLAGAFPAALQYACRYWIHHWTSASFQECDSAPISQFLKDHLLYWLEVMSLLGYLGEALDALRSLLSWMQASYLPGELTGFLVDACQKHTSRQSK